MRRILFSFKSENLLPLANFVRTSYERDREMFISFSPSYNGNHLADFNAQQQLVADRVFPKSLTMQLSSATERLYTLLEKLVFHLDKLERYLDKASATTGLPAKKLNLSAIRLKCRNSNVEGALKDASEMQQLIAPHLQALESVGYTPALQSELTEILLSINTENTLQDSLQKQRTQLVSDNVELLNALWETVNDILKTGKVLFKSNPIKVKDYTQSDILKKLEHSSVKKKETTDTSTAAS
jgi:hypothetical protein